jgi:hypothetical protein
MTDKKRDGFFQGVNKFFQRVQNKDLVQLGDNNLNTFGSPATADEIKRKSEFSIFRQYLQQKNWSTRHIELFDEYRKMDMTYPIISAAIRLYAQEVCLSGDTQIRTPYGDFKIIDLYNKGKDRDMFYVQSYNKSHGHFEWSLAMRIKLNGIKPVYKVVVERNIDAKTALTDTVKEASFKCTDNHEIMIDRKGNFKPLNKLKVGDKIFSHYKWVDPECACKKETANETSILSIEYVGEEEVFDLINVMPNNHFSIKLTDTFYVEVHNCTKDNDGNVLKVISDDRNIKKSLDECFFKNLKLNSQSYLLVKEMLKFGNLFCYLNTRRGVGVTDLIHLPPEALRIQLLANSPELDSFKYHWWGQGGGLQFEPWEIVHWKNIEDIELQPYGTSILRSVVDTWRRIILMREALIIYRITRAPQRYLFKIDTSGMDPDSALRFAEQMKKQLQKKPLVNPHTGEIDFKYNPISISEDFFQPTFEGDVGGIEVLESPSNMNDLEDYKVIKDDLFAGLLIPKSYLCLHPETKIKCLDGKDYSILEFEEKFKNGEEIYLYSATENGDIVPGELSWIGATKKETKTYIIELDNGEKVECSDNHPWMMREGSYKRADELKIGYECMPFDTNHKIKSITIKHYDEPVQLYDLTINNKYHNFALSAGVFVHNSFEEDLCIRLDTKVLTSEGIKEVWEIAEEFKKDANKKIFSLSCNKYGMISSGRILWCKPTKLVKELYKITINHQHIVEATDNHPFLLESLVYKRVDELKIGDLLKGMYSEKDFIVTNIEKIDLIEDEYVYDLEVDEFHNFALECGVFVHNSNKAALAQEDMRFSGAIKQYQSAFIEGLLHVALVHLHINGHSKEELESFELEMNTNSTLVEKNRNEILQQRLDLAKGFVDDSYGGAFMSFTQAMKEILKFTDEEIVKVFKDQMIEKKIFWRYAQLKEQGFFEEPDQEKKRAMMKNLNPDSEDIFSGLKFEAEKLPVVKNILTEKLDQELSYLKKNTKISASKKQIEIIRETDYEKVKNKTLRDLGMRG